jgi:polar amino acid transport system substrate-binding protein
MQRICLEYVHALTLVVVFMCCAGRVSAEPLNVYVGQGQMPFVGGSDGSRGIFGELMRTLCDRLGLDCRFRSVPWRRVQLDAAQDPHGIVLNLGRIPEREADFTWLLDVLPTTYVIVSRQARFDTLPAALQAGPLAVMGGTPRAQEVHDAARGGSLIVEVNDPEQAARMLETERVRSWYEIELRISYLWKKLGYDPRSLEYGKPLRSPGSFIAGGARLEGASVLQARMAAEFEKLKADGSWRAILLRYLDEAKVDELLDTGTPPAQSW